MTENSNEFFQDWLIPAVEAEFRVLLAAAGEAELWWAKRAAENGLDRLLEAQMWRDSAMQMLEDADVDWLIYGDDSVGEGEEDVD